MDASKRMAKTNDVAEYISITPGRAILGLPLCVGSSVTHGKSELMKAAE
jgi:hypothetical protein